MRILFSTLLVFLISSCATPPKKHTFTNSEVYINMTYDEVWTKAVSFLSENNIQIKNIAKDSGVIYAESTTFDDAFADCGQPGLLTVVRRIGTFNIFVNQQGGTPTVRVNTLYKEFRAFDNEAPKSWDCNSTGKLEKTILRSIY